MQLYIVMYYASKSSRYSQFQLFVNTTIEIIPSRLMPQCTLHCEIEKYQLFVIVIVAGIPFQPCNLQLQLVFYACCTLEIEKRLTANVNAKKRIEFVKSTLFYVQNPGAEVVPNIPKKLHSSKNESQSMFRCTGIYTNLSNLTVN